MMSLETLTVGDQITKLESEVALRTADIENLTEAIATLEAGEPRPASPKSDDAFELLKQLVGTAPQDLQEHQLFEVKLAAAQQTVTLSIEACREK